MRGAYVVGGYPDRERFIESMRILDESGFDFIEVGIPFNDPVADGPVIAEAIHDSVKNGTRPDDIISVITGLELISADKYIMTYGNIIYSYGIEAFNGRIRNHVKGIIIPDLPNRMHPFFKDKGLSVPLVPFATLESGPDDFKVLYDTPSDFIYFIGMRGTTGAKADFCSPEMREKAGSLRKMTGKKVVIGFGVKTAADIDMIYSIADGFVIGTEIVRRQSDPDSLREFCGMLSGKGGVFMS